MTKERVIDEILRENNEERQRYYREVSLLEKAGGHATANCTLRDLFAAHAMCGLLSRQPAFAGHPADRSVSPDTPASFAEHAYLVADQMLTARNH